jgi:hypothetical protein
MRWSCALVVVGALAASGQTPTGVITGQVIDGASGRPVTAAVVSINGPSLLGVTPGVPAVLTGSDGRFMFRRLEPGIFTITATKGGFAEGEPGRRRPGGSAPGVVLSAPDMRAEVVVPMWRYSVIAGTVLDEAAEPVASLQVRALSRISGRNTFSTVATTFTDDRGAFRFGNLSPGTYIIVASPAAISANAGIFSSVRRSGQADAMLTALAGERGVMPGARVGNAVVATGRGAAVPPAPVAARLQIYPPTWFPSALAPAQASPIVLGIGEERDGVDIQIVPARTARVTGVLLSGGTPAAMTTLRLVPMGADNVPADVVAPASVSDGAGNFTFAGVVPGRYWLRGSSVGGSGLGWVDLPLTVTDDDIDNLPVVMNPPLRISPRLQFDGAVAPPTVGSQRFTELPFMLEPVDGLLDGISIAGTIADGGAVTIAGYLPGRYRVRVKNAPAGWMFKAAMLEGVDVSETPFDFKKDITNLTLVFTDRRSGLSGRIDGEGANTASVLLFTSDTQAWVDAGPNSRRFRTARSTATGLFGISDVPPGEYYVLAVPDEQSADWRDPARLDALARMATQISIAEGETKTLGLRVQDVR